jgi:TonB family protein
VQTNVPPAQSKASAASQFEDAVKKPASPIEVLTDTMGVDFNPYLTLVVQSVRQQWYQLIPESAATKKGKVVLELFILKNGSITGLRVVESSGDVSLDRPGFGSIAGCNPFPPLPVEFKGPYLGLRFAFYYNQSPESSSLHSQTEPLQTAPPPSAQKQSTSGTPELATEAQSLYREGHFDEAAQRYQQLLQTQPISAEAYAGLTRVYLKQKKLLEAHETISKGLTVTDSAPIHVALGEVLFREEKVSEAEREWLGVTNSGHADARAHLGLARVSAAATQYRQAKKEIDEAHRLDPGDPDVQLYWIRSQHLPIGRNDSRRDCRMATDPASTETDLVLLSGDRPNQIRGYGLAWIIR